MAHVLDAEREEGALARDSLKGFPWRRTKCAYLCGVACERAYARARSRVCVCVPTWRGAYPKRSSNLRVQILESNAVVTSVISTGQIVVFVGVLFGNVTILCFALVLG